MTPAERRRARRRARERAVRRRRMSALAVIVLVLGVVVIVVAANGGSSSASPPSQVVSVAQTDLALGQHMTPLRDLNLRSASAADRAGAASAATVTQTMTTSGSSPTAAPPSTSTATSTTAATTTTTASTTTTGTTATGTTGTATTATTTTGTTATATSSATATTSTTAAATSSATATAVQTIDVLPSQKEQTYWGVGAAVTDSAAYLVQKLPTKERKRLLNKVYSASGLGLSFGVVPIGASDFTYKGTPYSYDDVASGKTDPQLAHFSINHDDKWNLPVIKEIKKIAPQIKLFATTWTAPAWMKANDALDDLGFKGSLLPQYYGSFADYVTDFLKAYKKAGIPIDTIAPENEPNSPSSFPSMDVNEQAEIELTQQYLAPAIKAAGLKTQILSGDVGMPRLDEQEALNDSTAANDYSGMAWHCYSAPPTQMAKAKADFPSKSQVVAECALNLSHVPSPVDVLGAFANSANAFSAWNLALNRSGGPVQVPNSGCGGCTGLLTIDEDDDSYSLSDDAYVLGQVGRYVKSGAVRLATTDEPSYWTKGSKFGLNNDGILNVAFRNPNGQMALVAYNQYAVTQTVHVVDGDKSFTAKVPAGAMTTFTWTP